MRKLSLWAKHHIAYARIIIILSRCLIFLIACFLGKQLAHSEVGLSPLWIYLLIAVFFIAGATYPAKRASSNFIQRKFYDLIVASCGFLITVCLFTQLDKPVFIYQSAEAAVFIHPSPYKFAEAQKLLEQQAQGVKKKFSHREKRIIKKEFNYQLVQYAKAKITGNKVTAEQTLIIILACIAAVGLLYLVVALACTLSCNGSDAAAIIVAVVGTAAIVWGLVAVVKAINRKNRKEKRQL